MAMLVSVVALLCVAIQGLFGPEPFVCCLLVLPPYSAPFPIDITLVFCHIDIDQNTINSVARYAFSNVN
jgi:hypothetical protein